VVREWHRRCQLAFFLRPNLNLCSCTRIESHSPNTYNNPYHPSGKQDASQSCRCSYFLQRPSASAIDSPPHLLRHIQAPDAFYARAFELMDHGGRYTWYAAHGTCLSLNIHFASVILTVHCRGSVVHRRHTQACALDMEFRMERLVL
jgi:hypothetical protein